MGAGAGALSTTVGKKDNMSKKASIASKNMYKKLQ